MSQRRTTRSSAVRMATAPAAYMTRHSLRGQSQATLMNDSASDNDDDARSNSEDSSNGSDNGGSRQSTETATRIAKAVRHLTLVIAPEPIEDFAADATHPLPYSIRSRNDESTEFNRIVEILSRLSCSSETMRAQLLDNTPMRLTGTRWGDVMLRRFSRSFQVIRARFIDWTHGVLQSGSDVIDTGNALRNWMSGLNYIVPDRFQHMSATTQNGFVTCILSALEFVVQADTDIRNMRSTPDYASQPLVQNNLYYNVVANGRGDAFGMPLLSPLRVVMRTEAQVDMVTRIWEAIRQRHLLLDTDSSRPKPSAQFIDTLSQLHTRKSLQEV